jgi:thiamine biosynthesis lipoprotein
MKRRSVALALVISILASFLCSCSFSFTEKKHVREYFGYFDTFSSLTIYTSDEKLFSQAADSLDGLLDAYNKLFDIYHSYEGITNLCDVNKNAGKGAISVDERLIDALEFGKEMHTLTNGHANIALGSVISLWHEAREYAAKHPEDAYIPDASAISEALLHTDINSLVIDKAASTVEITDEYLSLDLGAIAKGYIAERAAELLLDMDLESFLINLGGNVLAYGKKPDGSEWRSLIEDPFDSGKDGYGSPLSISERSLVTSGSYQRYYTVGGKNYSHIISKDDGMPQGRFVSVSVISPWGASGTADALSTALFCMTLEEGRSIIESLDGFEALWIFPDGNTEETEGFGGAK